VLAADGALCFCNTMARRGVVIMRDVANDARRLGRNLIELQCRATEGQCPICTREMQGQPVYHLKCGHTMHKGCVLRW
jgi:hypothetical protein